MKKKIISIREVFLRQRYTVVEVVEQIVKNNESLLDNLQAIDVILPLQIGRGYIQVSVTALLQNIGL